MGTQYGSSQLPTAEPPEITIETEFLSPPRAGPFKHRAKSLSPLYEFCLFAASKMKWKSLPMTSTEHRETALDWSLYANVVILITKIFAFLISGSLSVLAALVDSVLDILSQVILYWAEKRSKNSSAALYPAGASRFEPIGVVVCASLMGIGSLSLIKESMEQLIKYASSSENPELGGGNSSSYSLIAVIIVKVFLFTYCKAVAALLKSNKDGESTGIVEAMYQDHFNDALSNGIALVAIVCAFIHPSLWWFDPAGAILISLYIMKSWWDTGMEEVEKLVGKAAEQSFIDELVKIGENHHGEMSIDICRCYHFGPKFLVEMECVMPSNMQLKDTHDIGMDLQYKLENHPEVERAFVHIDYSKRAYDEHVSSKKYKTYQKQIAVDRATSPASNSSDGYEKV
ncbi:hypothetical protein TrST_g13882 [Triparma strigata]|uniref:Cation efflux protein cytoplasmic domain-containing protein n=1 Tax=Triparma strigata TaxID=1606541 RepID=A0A9W7AU97_9STRA|nr:hypothetical protein TrST_g13882 [Triparma strigata]